MALPSPKKDAPSNPDFPEGRIAVFTISHRVAPRAYAASFCESGIALITSLETADTDRNNHYRKNYSSSKYIQDQMVSSKKRKLSPNVL